MNKSQLAIIKAKEKGYYIDSSGNVFSKTGRKLKLGKYTRDKRNYYYKFCVAFAGSRYTIPVHKYIAYLKYDKKSFEEGIQTRHLNNNSSDNTITNIAIGTASDNAMDKSVETRKRTASHAASFLRKLSNTQLIEFRNDREKGMTYKQLCEKYKICKATVSYIVNKHTYRDD